MADRLWTIYDIREASAEELEAAFGEPECEVMPASLFEELADELEKRARSQVQLNNMVAGAMAIAYRDAALLVGEMQIQTEMQTETHGGPDRA